MPSAYCAQLTRDLLAIAKFLFYSLEYPVKRPLNTSLPNEAQYAYLVCLEKYVELFQFRTLYLILGGGTTHFWTLFWKRPVCRRPLCRNWALFRNSKTSWSWRDSLTTFACSLVKFRRATPLWSFRRKQDDCSMIKTLTPWLTTATGRLSLPDLPAVPIQGRGMPSI